MTNLAKLQRSKGETSKNIGLCGLSFGRAAQTLKAGLVSSPNRKIVVQSNRSSLARCQSCHALQRIDPLTYPLKYDRWERFVSTDRKGRTRGRACAQVVSVRIRIDGGSPWAVAGGPSASGSVLDVGSILTQSRALDRHSGHHWCPCLSGGV